ncbi:MAG: MgtC/SapB family protein [Bacillus sp. (in: firmicutes)]
MYIQHILDYILALNTKLDVVIKLGVSAVLGLIIGIEREMKGKPVGLKTCLVISIVSCLLTIVSIQSSMQFPGSDKVNITMDPLRLAAQIVSGIGFIGAGVILRRDNDSISGLTTAALIWGAAGMGIAVGAGFYFEAIAGVFLLIVSVDIIPLIMGLIGPRQLRQKDILLQLSVSDKKNIADILQKIKNENIRINNVRIKETDASLLVQLNIAVHYQRLTVDVYTAVSKIDGVRAIEIENL